MMSLAASLDRNMQGQVVSSPCSSGYGGDMVLREGAGDGGDNEPGKGHQDCGEDANSKCGLFWLLSCRLLLCPESNLLLGSSLQEPG